MATFLLWLIASGLAQESSPPEITIKLRGQVIRKLTQQDMAQSVKPVEVTDPHPPDGTPTRYRGFPINALFYLVYKEGWRRLEEVGFRGPNDSEAWVPVGKLMKYNAYLAYAKPGDEGLAPFSLVWDNAPEDSGERPSQITEIDLTTTAERFPNSNPPPKASPAARRGFALFRQHCASCHTINAEGGNNGLELNYPVSVMEYMKAGFVKKFIVDPSAVRFKSAMPAFNRPTKELNDLVAYLSAMAKAKRKPRGAP